MLTGCPRASLAHYLRRSDSATVIIVTVYACMRAWVFAPAQGTAPGTFNMGISWPPMLQNEKGLHVEIC